MSSPISPAAERTVVFDQSQTADSPRQDLIRTLTIAFLLLGVVARLARFLLRFPLWEDESFLAYNLMSRGFAQLLQPLDYIQVAPIGYLWWQRATIEVLGFTELSLRLSALLTGLGSLLLFYRLARLTLPGSARLFAVAIFAVSYPMIRYSAEAKQYGFDLFLSLAMLWCFLEWRRRPERSRWTWLALLLAGIGPFFSHPLVFIGGAISIAWLWTLWQPRGTKALDSVGLSYSFPPREAALPRSVWAFWLIFNVLMGSAFLIHYALARTAMGGHNDSAMHECWVDAFPPLTEPIKLAGWLVTTHAGDFLAYPLGGPRGASTLSFLGVIAGLALWIRHKRGMLLLLALVPLGLNFIAAALHRFPYGGHFKFGVYWAPLGTLLLGAALGAILPLRTRGGFQASRPAFLTLALLALIGAGILIRDFASPSKNPSDQRARDFARWFWHDAPHDAVVLCLHADLGRTFTKDFTSQLNWSAMYACNREIYSPRHARGDAPAWDKVSADFPLRCVEYRVGHLDYDEAARDRWLADMGKVYDLTGRDRYPAVRYDKHGSRLLCTDFIETYTFVPKAIVAEMAAARGGRKPPTCEPFGERQLAAASANPRPSFDFVPRACR